MRLLKGRQAPTGGGGGPHDDAGETSHEQQSQVNAKEKIGCVVTAVASSPDGGELAVGAHKELYGS